MPTKRITRIHSPDSVDDKKLVKNEAENGQLLVKKLQKNSFYKKKPSRAHKRVKHILFGRNSRAIQRMLFIWFIARSVISNMSVLPRPNLKLDLEITNLL